MGKRYLIDTNILIGFLEQALPPTGQAYIAGIIDEDFNISVINKIEILGYKDVSEETRNFIALASIFELDANVAEATIEIRKEKRIKLPDAIIAATALTNGLTILSRNQKDFKGILGLDMIDPFTLH